MPEENTTKEIDSVSKSEFSGLLADNSGDIYSRAYLYGTKILKTDKKLIDMQKHCPDIDWGLIRDRIADAYAAGSKKDS